ncbi:hypothetical protein E4T44_02987 [Aureobasidium sp. EXF-8845]|nr:hypothetical protein E4T44_02987 [Aureobasidium sp. EXF-8845]KAI4855481.1 hypothetical protein E4T45_03078 [Aureobasidium sp. EXF-8846]
MLLTATKTHELRERKGHKRESELLSLSTPAYFPLLESRRPFGLAAILLCLCSCSAILPIQHQFYLIARLYSALALTLLATTSPPSYRRTLGPRTPSSGTDQGTSLVSALKSPSTGPKMSNEKRVLFIVGDVVVAPSDNILSSADRDFDQCLDNDLGAGHIEVQPSAPHSSENELRPGDLSLGYASAACCLSVSRNHHKPTSTLTATSSSLHPSRWMKS